MTVIRYDVELDERYETPELSIYEMPDGKYVEYVDYEELLEAYRGIYAKVIDLFQSLEER